ncbi:MAG: CDP-alcohol phosphatidyltransferase family protein [Actinomycetota bacterium]
MSRIEETFEGAVTTNRVLTVPNVLSALRLASVPVFIFLFVTDREEAAVILYGAGALTDFFDGYLARSLGQVSEIGKLLDPLADRVFIVALALALVAVNALPWWMAAAIVARDLMLLSVFPFFERRGVGRIPVNFTGKTATAFLLLGLTWLALAETDFAWASFSATVGLIFVAAGTILYYVAAGMYAREAHHRLSAAELDRGSP